MLAACRRRRICPRRPGVGRHSTGVLEDVDAAGSASWSGNVLSVDADQFVFTINMDSSFIPASERGTVDFIIDHGIVTTSTSTGIFAGLLPSVGSSGTFSTAFSNDLLLDYDLGSLSGPNALVDFELGNAGEACAMPAPDTLLLAGTGLMLLGLFVRCSKASQGQSRKPPLALGISACWRHITSAPPSPAAQISSLPSQLKTV